MNPPIFALSSLGRATNARPNTLIVSNRQRGVKRLRRKSFSFCGIIFLRRRAVFAAAGPNAQNRRLTASRSRATTMPHKRKTPARGDWRNVRAIGRADQLGDQSRRRLAISRGERGRRAATIGDEIKSAAASAAATAARTSAGSDHSDCRPEQAIG